MKKIISIAVISAIITTPAYALFCPTNYNQINLGDSIDQVQQQCGAPDSQTKTQADAPVPQEWSYYVQPDPLKPNTLKVTVAFDASGKATNVGVNGTSLVTTQICGGKNIHLGDTQDQIKAACGSPQIVNKMQPVVGAPAPTPTEVVTFKYNSTPPAVLTFTNGKLTERK